jgi:uncharacterized membrane protein/uncharacterized membrane protein YeaQ/YmgE (transglycosylase-associated protein family)
VLQVITYLVTGLVVGWIVRTAARSRSFGSLGDLTIGSLGAMFGGWLARRFGVVLPDSVFAPMAVAFFGASALLAGMRVLQRLGVRPVLYGAVLLPAELEAQATRLAELQRRFLSNTLARLSPPANTNQAFVEQLTFGERLADRVATFGGSWTFIGLFLTFMLAWMAVNDSGSAFDPYPFILLNLLLSCLAALQAPIIMMSQNRQAQKDRLDAHNDYQVNIRAELQIAALHEKIDLARDHQWSRLLDLVEQQQRQLERLETLVNEKPNGGR